MISKKAQGGMYWSIIAIIILVISIIFIVAYYAGIFPRFNEYVQAKLFGSI